MAKNKQLNQAASETAANPETVKKTKPKKAPEQPVTPVSNPEEADNPVDNVVVEKSKGKKGGKEKDTNRGGSSGVGAALGTKRKIIYPEFTHDLYTDTELATVS